VTVSHRIEFEITCPSCSTAGSITVKEDAGPPFDDDPRRRYESIPYEFRINPGRPLTITCRACGTTFPSPF
jgi:uncharacterized Zn finger protein